MYVQWSLYRFNGAFSFFSVSAFSVSAFSFSANGLLVGSAKVRLPSSILRRYYMDHLRVYESLYPKLRLGKDNDGGYVICDLGSQYDLLLSGGVADDISFEDALLARYLDLSGYIFDGTVDMLPVHSAGNRLRFVRENIGSNLATYFGDHTDIFMKMDIEGAEVAVFAGLSDDDLLRIKQLVIEFHSAYQYEIPARLAKTHWLVHFHANNCGTVKRICGVIVPSIFECTDIRKNGETLAPNRHSIPGLFDQPNCPHLPEIQLRGPPYSEL